jgi:tetratricopeptide (TPR) repeat protein
LLDRMGAPGALTALDAAIAQGEATSDNYLLRADLLLRSERGEDALAAADAALGLAPESAEAWRLRAEAAMRTGRNALAVAAARRAATLAPQDSRLGLLLFEALTADGLDDEAASLIEALYRKAPRKAAIASAYARLLARRGEISRALPVALAGLAEEPTHPGLKALVGGLAGGFASKEPPPPVPPVANFVVAEAFAIDFTAAGNSAAHRVSGWSGQEEERVWSVGASSVLLLPALDPTTDWSLEINANPLVHPPVLPAQRLSVRLGSALLLEERLTKAQTLRVLAPRELLVARRPLPLVFEHPDYATPRDIGVNRDARPLAVCFRLIRVEPSRTRNADSPAGRNPPPAA